MTLPMIIHQQDFPFEEIRDPNGDFFRTFDEAIAAGHQPANIWSVVEGDDTFTYGPPHHRINLIGFTATREAHDHHTYYEEALA